MKNIKIITRILLMALLVCLADSCSESFIELAPISNANVENYYKSEADFETAIISVYDQWRWLFNTRWTEYTEFRGDTYTHATYSYYEISNNRFTLNTTSALWNDLYRLVTKSNIILDKIEEVELEDTDLENRIIAEARFFRAEAYFALVRFFGPVPLVMHEITSDEALQMGRTPISEVFGEIISDYTFAANTLPSTIEDSEYGRVSNYAAKGELARVYITLSGKVYNEDHWADAAPLLKDIIDNGPYAFADTYSEIFTLDGLQGEEIILSARFKSGPEGQGSGYLRNFIGIYNPSLSATIENGVFESYDTADLRMDVNLAPNFVGGEGSFYDYAVNKKFDIGGELYFENGNAGFDFPVLRYTDVLLLYAETLAEIANDVPTESLDILNEVRNRAGLDALTTDSITSIELFRTAMQDERRAELMFECVRWFDLVRTGKAVEALNVLNKDADETWLLYPIPQTEIDKVGTDVLPQNPGY